ncbi:MAG TPA: hypothetical protein VMU93_16620 [Caulobacteraceae bacterium]|nr:hypothetical protein [Caulobacteraceae bacterium]
MTDLYGSALSLRPSDDPGGGGPGRLPFHDPSAASGEDLAYQVEIWDQVADSVDQVLAVTASASIGYAAFYAATREFPERQIVLRHRNTVLSRWSGQAH